MKYNIHGFSRREFIAKAAAVAIFLTLLNYMCAAESVPAASTPNFVVILVDDLGYGDIEPFGSKLNRTPNLNRMASEGMKMASFYAAPVSTPSRAQIMTGCYAKRVSLANVLHPSDAIGLSRNELTVADLLKSKGYATMCIGKWHLGDQPDFLPLQHGFEHFLGVPYSNDMGENQQGRSNPPLPLIRDQKVIEAPVEQSKLTALYTEEAIKFISINRERPFFLYMPHTAVHMPISPGKDFQGKSSNGPYGDWMEEVDWSTGQILDTLRKLKLDSNTLVLFTSDNGPALGHGEDCGVADPLRGGKGSTWEGGIRTPMIAWYPGKIPAGQSCDAITSEMDILPTLVKLAGSEAPNDRIIDGKDIWPLLSGQTKASPHEALFYFNGLHVRAVRSGPWKLFVSAPGEEQQKGKAAVTGNSTAKRTQPDGSLSGPPLLYNLDTDIGEKTDVAAKNPDVVKKLLGYVSRMEADLGEGFKNGSGVRPCGNVDNPKPLLLSPQE